MDFIVEQFNICGFEKADLFVTRMLSDGKCLVLFDGLDEVSQDSNQDEIIRQIRNFSDKYSDNQFIISCRVAAYNHWFERFTDVEMADFDEKQMKAFIKNWFHKEPKVAAKCWKRLNSSPPLRELASVPLLLTLLCLEYSESNDFPPNRAELYKRAIETLLTKWDSSRRIRRDEVYKQLSIMRRESMFARIAFGSFSANEYFLREQTLAKMIETYIGNLPSFDPAELEPDSRAVLKAIEAQHGIFVERAKDVYSFAHLTFQEYFTAKYIIDNAYKENLLEKLVEEHLYDAKWKEVFLLVAGMLDNADELLWRMRAKANEALEVLRINLWFEKIQNVALKVKAPYPKVLVRSILAMDNSPIRSHTVIQPHENKLAFTIANIFRIIDDSLSVTKLVISISNVLSINFEDILGFDLDISLDEGLKKHDLQKLQNYFSANHLIISCLESGSYVSKDLREKLIHELFLPKGG